MGDYYEVIRKPVDITKILTKIDDGKYDDMDMMARDFDQLCLNTQKYNEDGSLIHEDSIVLQSVFTNAREKLQAEWKDDDEEVLSPSAVLPTLFARLSVLPPAPGREGCIHLLQEPLETFSGDHLQVAEESLQNLLVVLEIDTSLIVLFWWPRWCAACLA